MINTLHLLWIVPLSLTVGVVFTALFAINKDEDF